MQPSVTVLMPVYNAAPYLDDAIKSILQQTFKDFQFLIIDDGSTDRSAEVVNSYRDDRIDFICLPQNKGIISVLNLGMAQARGKFIARMDADDVAMPDRLQRQVAYMIANPKVGVLGTGVEYFGVRQGKISVPVTHKEILWKLMFGSPFYHPTVMMNLQILKDIGVVEYPKEYPHAEDYALWVELIHKVEFANLAEPLLKYRVSSTSVSATNRSFQHQMKSKLRRKAFELLYKEKISDEDWNLIDEDSKMHAEPAWLVSWYENINAKNSLFDYTEFSRRMNMYIKQIIIKRGIGLTSLSWFLKHIFADISIVKYIGYFSSKRTK